MLMPMKRITPIVKLTLKIQSKIKLIGYSDAYILMSRTITVPNTVATRNPNNRKNIINKTIAPFAECISQTIHK